MPTSRIRMPVRSQSHWSAAIDGGASRGVGGGIVEVPGHGRACARAPRPGPRHGGGPRRAGPPSASSTARNSASRCPAKQTGCPRRHLRRNRGFDRGQARRSAATASKSRSSTLDRAAGRLIGSGWQRRRQAAARSRGGSTHCGRRGSGLNAICTVAVVTLAWSARRRPTVVGPRTTTSSSHSRRRAQASASDEQSRVGPRQERFRGPHPPRIARREDDGGPPRASWAAILARSFAA